MNHFSKLCIFVATLKSSWPTTQLSRLICAQRLCRSVAPTYGPIWNVKLYSRDEETTAHKCREFDFRNCPSGRDLSVCKPITNDMNFAPVVSKLMEDIDGKQN